MSNLCPIAAQQKRLVCKKCVLIYIICYVGKSKKYWKNLECLKDVFGGKFPTKQNQAAVMKLQAMKNQRAVSDFSYTLSGKISKHRSYTPRYNKIPCKTMFPSKKPRGCVGKFWLKFKKVVISSQKF